VVSRCIVGVYYVYSMRILYGDYVYSMVVLGEHDVHIRCILGV